MTTEEMIQRAQSFNNPIAIVFAAKIIADAIDRHTELQRKNVEMQMKMVGLSGKAIKQMMDMMKNDGGNEGEEWKYPKNNDDDDIDDI